MCLLTESLAARMFPDEDPIGSIARINTLPLTVIGTFSERVSTLGIGGQALAYPRRLSARRPDGFLRVLYASDHPPPVPEVTDEVTELLDRRHRTARNTWLKT